MYILDHRICNAEKPHRIGSSINDQLDFNNPPILLSIKDINTDSALK